MIQRELRVRAWAVIAASRPRSSWPEFFFPLLGSGWSPGDDVSAGTPLHLRQSGSDDDDVRWIVACQVGTALAARTATASLREVGLWTNRLLLWESI